MVGIGLTVAKALRAFDAQYLRRPATCALRVVAVLAAASTDSFDQAFDTNASTLISSAGFVEREFQASLNR